MDKVREVSVEVVVQTFLVQNDHDVHFKSRSGVYYGLIAAAFDPTASINDAAADCSSTIGVTSQVEDLSQAGGQLWKEKQNGG